MRVTEGKQLIKDKGLFLKLAFALRTNIEYILGVTVYAWCKRTIVSPSTRTIYKFYSYKYKLYTF